MAKRYIALIVAVLAVLMPVSANAINAYAAKMTDMRVIYQYYNTSGGYSTYLTRQFQNFNEAKIELFQIDVDDMAQRSDGYLYNCITYVWLEGVTNRNSISIKFGNPCVYNVEVEGVYMTNPYNKLVINLFMEDGSSVLFSGSGMKNDLGNVSTIVLDGYGTCEMSDEIVVSIIKGVPVSRIEISVAFYADQTNPPYRPMSWWGDGELEFGLYDNVPELVESIDKKVDEIIVGQETIIQQNQTLLDRMTNGFKAIGGQVKTAVTEAVNELFVPDEQAVQDFFTNMNEMEEEHLKPIAQVKDTVNTIEQTLFNPDYDAQISGDLAPVAGYINAVQGDGVFIFPGYEMKLKEGNFPLWEDYVIDVGATLDDMGLSWIPTVTKAICVALFTWRFLIMVLRWLMKVTDNPTFGQWADMFATFDFNYKTGW